MPPDILRKSIRKSLIRLKSRQALELYLLLVLAIQFQFNSRVGDDWPNSNAPSYILWRYGELTVATIWNEMSYWISAWANGQGRFFPMAIIQGNLVFFFFQTQAAVRIFYSVIFVVFILLWMSLIRRVTHGSRTSSYFLIVLAITIQFRTDFEPHIGFAQLVIWALIWFAISSHFLLNSLTSTKPPKKFLHAIAAGVFYFISLCQYELTIFLLPLFFVLTIIFMKPTEDHMSSSWKITVRRFMSIIPILGTTFLYLIIVFVYLRPKANPDGAYVLGFDIWKSSRTFLIQLYAGFPLAGHKIVESFKFPRSSMYLTLILLMTVAYYFLVKNLLLVKIPETDISYSTHRENKSAVIYLFLFGLQMMMVPSVMISLQPAWWDKMNFGSTYLGVVFAEIGLAIIVASLLTFFEQKNFLEKDFRWAQVKRKRHNMRPSLYAKSRTLKSLIVLLAFVTFMSNFRMVETTQNRIGLSSSWGALTKEASFFSKLKDRDFLFSTTYNDAYEINVANIHANTGVRLGQIFYPPNVWPNYLECQNYKYCQLVDVREKSAATLVNYSRGSFPVAKTTKEKLVYGDWPTTLSQPNALDGSSFWYFNIFMITENTALAYLVPMDGNPTNALARPHEVVLYTLILKNSPVITPAFMGICLEEKPSIGGKPHTVNGVKVIKWELPQVYRAPSGEITQLEDRVDIRQISNGSC
jgi:hypothetical protein